MANETSNEKLIEARKARARRVQRESAQPNPLYGTDVFEPDSYVATQFSDPVASQPLPSGRYVDSRFPSPLAQERASNVSGFQQDPKQYVKEHTRYLNDEQSLIDKGKSMMAKIFDYRDDADLSLFNVNLSPVESIWDGFLRYMTGGFDLLNIGYGGIISAMPGGLQTLSYDELSGGKSVAQVLSGEMEPGSAPSPGQIAIASIALESKRIREGNLRLTDLALLSPVTLPFIMAGIGAETSPLQQDNFNIMDKAQREKAFGSGWEQWMSGITDFGLMFADPTIGAGVAIKVARAGAMGLRGTTRTSQAFATFSRETLDDMTTQVFNDARPIDAIFDDMLGQSAQVFQPTTARSVSQIVTAGEDFSIRPYQVFVDDPKPESLNWLGSLYWDIAAKDRTTGLKKMTVDELSQLREIDKTPNRADIATLLYKADNPLEVGLVFESVMGNRDAFNRLTKGAPALADEIRYMEMQRIRAMAVSSEPMKIQEASNALMRQMDIVDEQIQSRASNIRDITGKDADAVVDVTKLTPQQQDLYVKLKADYTQLQNSRDAVKELHDFARYGVIPDRLDPNSAFFNLDEADAVLSDLWRRQGLMEEAARKNVYETLLESRMPLMTKNNAYTRMVAASRRRRGRAAYEYAVEGTNILPKRIPTVTAGGTVKYDWSWMSKSQFEGTSRLDRSLRVWRWIGEETPSGYIGLKGTATVGSEREFRAATNLDMYKGDGVQVTYNETRQEVIDGKTVDIVEQVTRTVGGMERRQQLYQQFYEALNDPAVDSMRALEDIEQKIMEDVSLIYGIETEKMSDVLKIANKRRNKSLEIIRKRGYFVDEDRTVHTIPYLETHLINGTYMHNFQEIEKMLREASQSGKLSQIQRSFDIPVGIAGSFYDVFQNFWRPMTLLRLNYTQRNVFEGLLRSMAYSASLAPLTWPVRGTAYGIRNAVMKRVADRQIKKVEERIAGTDYATARNDVRAATIEQARLENALPIETENGMMFDLITKDIQGVTQRRRMTEAEYEAELASYANRIAAGEATMAAKRQQFEDVIANTKFKTWRDAQLKDIDTEIRSAQNSTIVMLEQQADNVNNADLTWDQWSLSMENMDPITLGQLAQETETIARLTQLKMDLMDDPSLALGMWQSAAQRQKRIGSGTTIGPDGNYYGDAFADPLQQINRGALSADSTVKQSLSLRAGAWYNLFSKQVVRTNQAVPFTPATRKQWLEGMAQVIEDDSSSRVVRRLLNNDFDVQETVSWLMSKDPQAREFVTRVIPLMKGDVSMQALRTPTGKMSADALERTGEGVPTFASVETLATGERRIVIDEGVLRAYVVDTADKIKVQMQNQPVFLDLLRVRARQKETMQGPSGRLEAKDIETALAQLTPEQQAQLGAIQGSEIIQMGADSLMGVYAKGVDLAFKWLGTIPEDALVRGPFYNTRFKAVRNDLIKKYWEEQGMLDMVRAANRNAKDSAGVRETMTMEHDAFKISPAEMSRITQVAHRQALTDTREFLYTIERRTNLGKYGEYVWPFISATQNTVTTVGKLLWKEPWLAPFIATVWQAPNRLGFEDDQGNLILPLPTKEIKEFLKDRPEIFALGGVMDVNDQLLLPKNAANVWFPESGFGMVPRPGPLGVIAASELMKLGAFPTETPEPLKAALGEEEAAMSYKYIKDYIFGEDQGASEVFLSADRAIPAWIQRISESKSEFSKEYGYQYAMQRARLFARFYAGELDKPPTPEEIHKRTTNTFWFYVMGQQGLPNPLNPLPTLSRPTVSSPTDVLVEQLRLYREKDPANALLNFSNDFGDWALQAALTNVSVDVGGGAPTNATISDIKTLDPLIRKVAPMLGDNKDVLGMLVNNRNSLAGEEPTLDQVYDPSAYALQKDLQIGGTTETWRTVLGPAVSEAERQRLQGWTIFRSFMDVQEARLASRGLTSFEVAAAADLKQANKVFLNNMRNNPEMAGWVVDYDDIGGNRLGAAVTTLTAAVEDPGFQKLMIGAGKGSTLSCMGEYLQHRAAVISLLSKSGAGIEDDKNWWIKQAWETVRLKLKQRDTRWADIANRYLANDENPRPQLILQDANVAMGSGM